MIKEVSGDILHSKAHAIAHGVGPGDDFKQGLALALRERWPGMYKDFRHYCQSTSAECGTVWSWMGPGSPIIVSLFTQEPPTQKGGHAGKAHVEHVGHALRELRKEIETKGIKSIALPKVATGVGGLKWEEVKPMIDRHLGDLKIPVYLYTTYKKDQAAAE